MIKWIEIPKALKTRPKFKMPIGSCTNENFQMRFFSVPLKVDLTPFGKELFICHLLPFAIVGQYCPPGPLLTRATNSPEPIVYLVERSPAGGWPDTLLKWFRLEAGWKGIQWSNTHKGIWIFKISSIMKTVISLLPVLLIYSSWWQV